MAFKKKNLTRKIEESETEIFGPCHDFLEEEQQKKIAEYKWNKVDSDGFSCKIYPSSLKSLAMCPKTFIEKDVHTPLYFALNSLEAMEAGKAIHTMYGNVLKRIPGFIAKPNLEHYKKLYPHLIEIMERKNSEAYPEAYFYDPEVGVSGRMDVPKASSRLISDLKSTCIPDVDFDKEEQRYRPGFWRDYKSKLPDPAHRLQVGIYLYYARKYKLFDCEMTHGQVAYFNTAMKRGTDEYFEAPKFLFTDAMYNSIDKLFHHFKLHRDQWMATEGAEGIACTYPLCPIHGGVKA